jgi:hypothetical protein
MLHDNYLDPLKEPRHTDAATSHIEVAYPDITDPHFKPRLIAIHTYMTICLENQTEAEDLFGIKYDQYKKQLQDTTTQARELIKAAQGLSSLAVSLERA